MGAFLVGLSFNDEGEEGMVLDSDYRHQQEKNQSKLDQNTKDYFEQQANRLRKEKEEVETKYHQILMTRDMENLVEEKILTHPAYKLLEDKYKFSEQLNQEVESYLDQSYEEIAQLREKIELISETLGNDKGESRGARFLNQVIWWPAQGIEVEIPLERLDADLEALGVVWIITFPVRVRMVL